MWQTIITFLCKEKELTLIFDLSYDLNQALIMQQSIVLSISYTDAELVLISLRKETEI